MRSKILVFYSKKGIFSALKYSRIDVLHQFVATPDTYSYLYEAMEQAEIIFSEAQGIATDFLSDGGFDFSAFQGALRETRHDQMCQKIAATEMGVDDLDQYPGLRNALIKAYEFGKKDSG